MAKDIGRRVREHALAARPPLYQWMYRYYAQLKPVLTGPRPSWEALTKAAFDDGQMTKDGTPYTRQIAWKTWKQLHRDMETAAQATHASSASVKPTSRIRSPAERQPAPNQPPPSRSGPPADARADDGEIVEPTSRFIRRPAVDRAKPKGST